MERRDRQQQTGTHAGGDQLGGAVGRRRLDRVKGRLAELALGTDLVVYHRRRVP